eukprot:5825319-Karenia_brevis.AAC.1
MSVRLPQPTRQRTGTSHLVSSMTKSPGVIGKIAQGSWDRPSMLTIWQKSCPRSTYERPKASLMLPCVPPVRGHGP